MDKFIIVSFVSQDARCSDYRDKMLTAVRYGTHNLHARHNIILEETDFLQNGDMLLHFTMPDKTGKNFRPGPRLKGIGQYLLKYYPDIFKPKLIGTRLFSYETMDINFFRKGPRHLSF